MKITKLEIKEHNQFKNFEIDLTYPAGHEKAGQPLEKVCFIGQNGTGKTSLLRIINDLISSDEGFSSNLARTGERYPILPLPTDFQYSIKLNYVDATKDVTFVKQITGEKKRFWGNVVDETRAGVYLEKRKTKLINIPYGVNDRDFLMKAESKQFASQLIKSQPELHHEFEQKNNLLRKKQFFDYALDDVMELFKAMLLKNTEYYIKEVNFSNKIKDELFKDGADIEKLQKELREWKQANPNPLTKIAKILDPILEKFNLKIKEELDISSPEDLYFIRVKNSNNNDIPAAGWSSGTKQIIISALPLLTLDTWETVVLIDEPECSLYPDTQYEIIDFYKGLAPDAQFFIATHSPMIAASFEPWEIIELQFNEEGFVAQKLYYKGERHVDNYTVQPQYLRWDSLLNRFFGLQEEGNLKRKEQLMELAKLDVLLQKETDSANKARLWEEFKALATKLDWKI